MIDYFTVTSQEAHLRLDKLLCLRFPQYSRTYFQNLIQKGCVLINKQIVKKREKPGVEDEVEICFELTEELDLSPENIPLQILFEDEHLIAVDKPVGMVVHPAPGHPSGTFANALLYHCKTLPGASSLRPGIVHRLDKETSGVLIAAKTQQAHQKLVEAFSSRSIEKTYLAIAIGKVQEGLIDAPLKRHPIHRKEMAVDLAGKEAKTFCELLDFNGSFSLVSVRLITGRTHQIRVHFKYRNTPILGDSVYGNERSNQQQKAERQLLHAYRLCLSHPITGAPLSITAPIPSDFQRFIQKMNLTVSTSC
ncbi:MAG: RluA family pseudouridine synthase [Chlamydiales bacterium]|nr:RluA family pseudouridine synthase [Chlamydiales bacterium]